MTREEKKHHEQNLASARENIKMFEQDFNVRVIKTGGEEACDRARFEMTFLTTYFKAVAEGHGVRVVAGDINPPKEPMKVCPACLNNLAAALTKQAGTLFLLTDDMADVETADEEANDKTPKQTHH